MAVKLLHSKNEIEIKDNVGMATPKLPVPILCQDNDSKSQTTPEKSVDNTTLYSRQKQSF